ncbi:MAG: hypothetical protein A4E71_02920 [Smithella sp. PtaU1.Bin162]|nr:MAG: hypothetical protein A4E71_02920 [Smithella sp. PtaU1.Bin162]
MIPIHHGIITGDKLILDNPIRYLDYFKKLSGKRVELTLKEEKSQRSLNQNNYYWGVVLKVLSEHTGYDPDDMHEICRYMFLKSFKTVGNFDREYVKSTTELNTAEFEEYLEKIRRWAAVELNCYTPLPNEIAA